MSRFLVLDASCLIDLRRGGLLVVSCALPYDAAIPLAVRHMEVLGFSATEWCYFDDHGMITLDPAPEETVHAVELILHHRTLSLNDCICLASAVALQGTLLTGDNMHGRVATKKGLSVHGVLWIVDQLMAVMDCPDSLLVDALRIWEGDRAVFLPRHAISDRLGTLAPPP